MAHRRRQGSRKGS